MAKRFTDSGKWNSPFIRGLKAPYKLLWLYIQDECDHAGIWQVDFEVAQVKIGEKLDYIKAIESFGKNVVEIGQGERWFLPSFIDEQYGILNPENKVHNSVIKLLRKFSMWDEGASKPLASPLQGAKDKDKDTVKDEAKDEGIGVKGERETRTQLDMDIDFIIQEWNRITGQSIMATGKANRQTISARLKEGFTKEQLIAVIEKKNRKWKGTSQADYIRIETLFAPTKFEGYLNEPETTPPKNQGGFQQNQQPEKLTQLPFDIDEWVRNGGASQ